MPGTGTLRGNVVEENQSAPLYNLAMANPVYYDNPDDTHDGISITNDDTYAAVDNASSSRGPTLPKRRQTQEQTYPAIAAEYHYEIPFDDGTTMSKSLTISPYAASTTDPDDELPAKPMSKGKLTILTVAYFFLGFVGGLAGGAVLLNMPSSVAVPESSAEVGNSTVPIRECQCMNGSVTFSTQEPPSGSCWQIANGTNGTPDMMQHNGLYVRSGLPENAGNVMLSATAAADLTVTTESTVSLPSLGNVVGNVDTKVDTPVYYRLSPQAIEASHGSLRGWPIQPTIESHSTLHSSASETRPVSMVLIPLICFVPGPYSPRS